VAAELPEVAVLLRCAVNFVGEAEEAHDFAVKRHVKLVIPRAAHHRERVRDVTLNVVSQALRLDHGIPRSSPRQRY
ncbi:MAG: hypothetical protein C4291_14460, partial [Candidatus Dadabacteria bacterium]